MDDTPLQSATTLPSATSGGRLQRIFSLLIFVALLLLSGLQATYLLSRVKTVSEQAAVGSAIAALENTSHEFETLLQHGSPIPVALDSAARSLGRSLPGANLYVIDGTGVVQSSVGLSSTIRSQIDPAPIFDFVRKPNRTGELYRVDDPTEVTGKGLFVAKGISVETNPPTYLVVMLDRTIWLRSFRFAFDENIIFIIAGMVAVQVVMGGAFAYLFYRTLTLRIKKLLNVLITFSKGDHSARVLVRGRDDLSELANVTNSMAETIEQTLADLSDRDKKRRELIADVTHDLRAPTAIIRSGAERLLDSLGNHSNDDPKQLGESLKKSSESLSRLLGQLWELSRIETKDRPLQLDLIALAELVYEIAESFIPMAREKNIELCITGGTDHPEVIADIELITRALANLIENALTYTLTGGTVEIRIQSTASTLDVSVCDTGVGIAEAEVERIFERNYRVERWRNKRVDSSGLGLAIVRCILEAHGSSISVTSRENEGSEFRFSLPIAPAQLSVL